MEYVSTVVINVVTYEYDINNKDTPYKVTAVDRDSFVMDMDGDHPVKCSKEIKKKLEELQELWNAWTSQKSQELTQSLTSQNSPTLEMGEQKTLPSPMENT